MEQKINIAELLKDCPSGMELDCTMIENVYFDKVLTDSIKCYYIKNSTKTRSMIYFTKFGEYVSIENAKCIIFPKGKTTWEGFHRPFKDGDVIANNTYIVIFHKLDKMPNGTRNDVVYYHCWYHKESNNSKFKIDFGIGHASDFRFATGEEKQKLFKVIKENGYRWNPESKTLEKLVKPKFKVGDRIKSKNRHINYLNDNHIYTITKILDGKYWSNLLAIEYINKQDDWELVPNKFDITTLKPFDKVLARDFDNGIWEIDFFSRLLDGKYFKCLDLSYIQCIPYESNEHLLGTSNDCDDYYKTW